MNTLTKALVTTALIIGSIGSSNAASKVIPGDDYITTKICVVATQGSKAKLSYAIKDSGLKKNYIAKNVKCNKVNIVSFIEEHGSNVEEINSFLTHGKYTKGSDVTNIAAQ